MTRALDDELRRPRRFLEACLLLLVAEQPGHGYDLAERLKAFGFARSASLMYRTLERLDEEGFLESRLEVNVPRPSRRVYALRPDGWDGLARCHHALTELRRRVDAYLARADGALAQHRPPPGASGSP